MVTVIVVQSAVNLVVGYSTMDMLHKHHAGKISGWIKNHAAEYTYRGGFIG